MKELELKYGCNPNQKPSKIYMEDGSELPIKVLSGKPGYINFLDAFNGWQLVRDLKKATGLPAATSFKHVSPAGASIGLPLTETLAKIYWVEDMDWQNFSPLACAYARARGADRMSSFGDFISLSDVCDKDTALLIKREVSDGVIAPGYTEEALEVLKQKKKGNYNVIQIDPEYVPAPLEHKQVFGVTFEQGRQELAIDDELISNIVTEEEATYRGISINATVSFTVAQAVAVAEAVERGLKRREAEGLDNSQMAPICTIMIGRTDDWLKKNTTKTGQVVLPEVLEWSGVAVIKEAYRIYKERGYTTRLLSAANRNVYHWCEILGGDLAQTINYSWHKRLNSCDVEVKDRMADQVPEVYMNELNKIEEFHKSFEENGMKPEEFVTYGGFRDTLTTFIAGYDDLCKLIRGYMI